MVWSRRRVMASSAVSAVILASAAALLLRPQSVPPVSTVKKAWAVKPLLGVPVLGAQGNALTQTEKQSALLVNPSKVSKSERAALQQAMGVGSLGHRPRLWLASAADQRRFAHQAGIGQVSADVVISKKGVAAPVVAAIDTGHPSAIQGLWVDRQGVFHAAHAVPLKTSLNLSLTQKLQGTLQGSGAALIVGAQGDIEAVAGSASQGFDLTKAQSLGLAALPPLLAVALHNPQVQNTLKSGAVSLGQMAKVWGRPAMKTAVNQLGLSSTQVPGMSASGQSSPAIQLSADSLSQGAGLSATPAALAESYLPFVDQGHRPPLSWGTGSGDGAAPVVSGKFAETLQQIPTVKENNVTFHVWRPAGQYAVIVAPSQKRVAVLEGTAVQSTLTVLQIMAGGPTS